jgi:type II secretory ATPase GspE/PulE/Tfp pilus assembly ATPase PilB-like protein
MAHLRSLVPFPLIACFVLTLSMSCSVPVQAQGKKTPDQTKAEQAERDAAKKAEAVSKNYAEQIQNDLFNEGWLGPGGYFSPVKLSLYILVFLAWVGCASWSNSDQERLKKTGRESFNLLYTAAFTLGGTLALLIPVFAVSFVIVVLLCFVPVLMYVSARNKGLPPADKVLTGEHLFYLFAVGMSKIGIKMNVEPRRAYSGGPPIEFQAIGVHVEESVLAARLIAARNTPGYNLFRENIYEAIKSQATSMMFDFSPNQTLIRHQVDGTWLQLVPSPRTPGQNRDKDAFEEMLEAAKKLVGGKPEDRRSKQVGKFVALVGSKGKGKKKPTKYEIDFMSQGTKTGEALVLQLHTQTVTFQNLAQLGVRAEAQPLVMKQLNSPKGIFLVAAPPAHGLRSTFSVLQRVCDRFTKDVVNVEDESQPSEPLENIVLAKYDSNKGETPMKVLPDVCFRGASVLFVRDIANAEVLQLCCDEVAEDRQFMLMYRAKDGVDALLRLLSGSVPATAIVPVLNAVMTQRLIRKLCPSCKEQFQPDAKLLQQLGLRPEQAKVLYRKRTPLSEYEERKRGICPQCNGIGYKGRTGLFELLTLSDEAKALLLSKPEPKVLRQHFNKEGQRGFLFEGIHLLLKGETSVEELSNALKM